MLEQAIAAIALMVGLLVIISAILRQAAHQALLEREMRDLHRRVAVLEAGNVTRLDAAWTTRRHG